MKNYRFLFLLILISLFACKKEDEPIDYSTSKESPQKVRINLKTDFNNQVYYSIQSKKIVSTNNNTEWDLAFASTSKGAVFINSSKKMVAAVTNQKFDEVNSIDGLRFTYDESNLLPSRTAFGILKTTKTYVIDRGINGNGTHLGYVKLEFTNLTGAQYSFRYSDLSSHNSTSLTLNKNEDFNRTMLSFDDGFVPIEPRVDRWEFLFSKYLHTTTNGTNHEIGVVINTSVIDVAKISKEYSQVTAEDIAGVPYLNNADIIGYDWKNNSSVDKNKSYFLIHKVTNKLYKLHFTSFNDSNGTISFEFEKL